MKKIIALLSLLLLTASLYAQQQQPFGDEINNFKKLDSQQVEKGIILFTGSSSIRMWQNLEQSFPGYKVLNRGFGGSTLADLDRYLPDIVYPYQPKQILIYSGENDIAVDSISADQVLTRFQTVFQKIRAQLPTVPIEYISIKPSPSRLKFLPVVKEANELIRNYLRGQSNTHFIDVFSSMLDGNGQPKKGIYIEDNLHMNSKGYEIWQGIIQPYLIK
ncbi:MAG TPA: GDSL-type esterase/lipase family protein [Flavitalea sp.]|nr:GDSL-type esterase/lipase family protein [Flavitalea sp.]